MTTAGVIIPDVFKGEDEVVAGFSRRDGGVSRDAYGTLNLGLSTGDVEARVQENRRRVFEAVDLDPRRLAIAGQVHGSDIAVVSEPGCFAGHDGLITTTPQLTLCITAADCAAVLLADPSAGVIGACHSGWRGTVADVSGKTVAGMAAMGADPRHILAYVSPCISAPHFEVGEEVAERFEDAYVVRRADWPKPHIDLKAAIYDQLRHAGVPAQRIEVSPHCTFSESNAFFSYRADDGETGRMMGFVCLRKAVADNS